MHSWCHRLLSSGQKLGQILVKVQFRELELFNEWQIGDTCNLCVFFKVSTKESSWYDCWHPLRPMAVNQSSETVVMHHSVSLAQPHAYFLSRALIGQISLMYLHCDVMTGMSPIKTWWYCWSFKSNLPCLFGKKSASNPNVNLMKLCQVKEEGLKILGR